MKRPDANLHAAIAVTRFGLGARPGEITDALTDPQGWLLDQIRPEGADTPVNLSGAPFPSSRQRVLDFLAYREAVQTAGKDPDARKTAAQALNSETGAELHARAVLAASTAAPFRERWALFWANHFSVSVIKGEELAATAPAFDREAIRPHVFGRFEGLLLASTRHPAMLMYLDQQRSTGPNSALGQKRDKTGLNENLAREVMELHTLGADAGYTQADVTEFARALTGWSMGGKAGPEDQQGIFVFRPVMHEPGPRTVFGRTYSQDDEAQAIAILRDLAKSPHTADHVARQLATHFVADAPPPELVATLKQSFLETDGSLDHLARALITSPAAWTPGAAKLKTPYEFLISSHRAAGTTPVDLRKDLYGPLTALGQRPYSAPQPNGWSDQASDWASPDAIVKRLSFAQGFASAHAPLGDPIQVAKASLGARLSPAALTAISRAESREDAFAILLMSPEFQRR